MATIVIRDDCDECVTGTSANSHDWQKSPDTVVRSTCRREKHAGGKRERYRRRNGKSTGAPFVKKAENPENRATWAACAQKAAWCIALSRPRSLAPLFLRGCETETAYLCTCARWRRYTCSRHRGGALPRDHEAALHCRDHRNRRWRARHAGHVGCSSP